jgi:hypothetical protein
MLRSEMVPGDALVSARPVLGPSLVVSTRLLAPLVSTDCTDPLGGVVACYQTPVACASTAAVFFGGITILMSVDPAAASASYIVRES